LPGERGTRGGVARGVNHGGFQFLHLAVAGVVDVIPLVAERVDCFGDVARGVVGGRGRGRRRGAVALVTEMAGPRYRRRLGLVPFGR